MKINYLVTAIYIINILIPISCCVYLDVLIKNKEDNSKLTNDKFFIYEENENYEKIINYNTGFSDGYESAKKEMSLSILTKSFEKCMRVEFPLNKWIPSK